MKDYHMLWAFETGMMMGDIKDGITFYQNKYGRTPNVVYINPQYGVYQIPGVDRVVAEKFVAPCHVYIGVE